MKTKSEPVEAGTSNAWGGYFELQNNLNTTIYNLVVMHQCVGGSSASTGLVKQLGNNGNTSKVAFTTLSGKADYWYVSFTDVNGLLWTANLHDDFHVGSNGHTVELSLHLNSDGAFGYLVVTIDGKSSSPQKFDQNH